MLMVSFFFQASFIVVKGSIVIFFGMVVDNYFLSEGGNGIVFLSYIDLSLGNIFSIGVYVVFEVGVEKDYNFDFEYIIF